MITHKTKIIVSIVALVFFTGIVYYFLIINTKKVISPVVVKTEISIPQEKKIEEKNDFYDISATYPVDSLDKENAVESFVTYKINEKKEEWKIGGKAYLEEKKVEKDFPDKSKAVYQYSMTYKKYVSKKVGTVSYVITTYEFTGGANGNTAINTFTFNKSGLLPVDTVLNFENSNDITLSRVLASTLIDKEGENASKEMVLDGLGLSYLKADGKTLDTVKCHCDGFFFPSNFQNFVVEDEGLRFLFNKYQVAPGSEGTPDILLNWGTLKPYTQKEFSIF
jgi:hypothetical protein